MPKVISIEYGEETSVRINQYQYIKPRLSVTATVNEDESFDEALDKIKAAVRERLSKIEKEIYKREHNKKLEIKKSK